MRRCALVAFLSAAAFSHGAFASDSRIRQILYDPLTVTTLRGCFGLQLTVAFAPGELIENVAIGDAQLWQTTPNRRADLLFLKPTVHNARTNMMVVTDRRRYAFDLTARDDAACRTQRVIYELQFTYPPEPAPASVEAPPAPAQAAETPPPAAPALPAPASRNTAYTFTGTVANVPTRAFDDGQSTYMRWADGAAAPAIFTLGTDKTETLVNYTIKGDYLVIDGVAAAFVLRRGAAVAVLYNDAYQQPKLDSDSPRPRAEAAGPKHSLFANLFGRAPTSQEIGR
jgi:type IV secretion system protein VirB9